MGGSKAGLLPFVPGAGQGPSFREHWTVGVRGLLVFPVSLVMPSGLRVVCLSVLTPAERMKQRSGISVLHVSHWIFATLLRTATESSSKNMVTEKMCLGGR